MSLIPDIPPELFSLSAVAVGYILIDDATANEQNALGNWLMLTAQVLCTNAYYNQVQKERQEQSSTSTNQSYSKDAKNCNYESNDEMLALLTKMVSAMQKEINEIKKNI